jgi:hypothetical protein
MKKNSQLTVLVIILLVIGLGLFAGIAYFGKHPANNSLPTAAVFNPLTANYLINGEEVSLVNGKAVGGDNSKTTTAVFGEPMIGDLNGDGVNDAALIITQDSGGSGLFYYVAAAINTKDGAEGTNAVLLGDRIAPQNGEITDGQIIENYADRKISDPMTTAPSVGVSLYLALNGTTLEKTVAPTQKVTYLISEASTTKYCNGVDMDSAGYQKTITVKKSTSTEAVVPTTLQIVKTVISAATTGMCHTVMTGLNVSVNGGVVKIPAIDGWAGVSIVMCSCKPQVEVNLLQIPGITQVVW